MTTKTEFAQAMRKVEITLALEIGRRFSQWLEENTAYVVGQCQEHGIERVDPRATAFRRVCFVALGRIVGELYSRGVSHQAICDLVKNTIFPPKETVQ
jgi:hypothetical protein